uniref:C2 domain-containing protein n=1 Tax=Caenorhabditis japonica TaxID=281687 RepID=A0A8R1DJ37_CAEJA
MHLALLFALISPTTSQFWLTTVVTELKIREECSTFWNRTNACLSPLFRISTDVNSPTQFASRAWPLSDLLSTQQPFFTSQWHGQLESVRVSAHIEASAALNPFGRVAECDQGVHPKIAFNLSGLNARSVIIDSQCFHAKVLVKFDTKCPYCPAAKANKTEIVLTPDSRFRLSAQQTAVTIILLPPLTILCVIVFLLTLQRFLKLKRREFQQYRYSTPYIENVDKILSEHNLPALSGAPIGSHNKALRTQQAVMIVS